MDGKAALEQLTAYLEKEGLKLTHQRRLICEAFFDPDHREDHPSVEELHARVRDTDRRIGYATVYRTLKLLVDCGLASPRDFGDNQTRYEPNVEGEHHDHLVCLDCGDVVEFENEQIERLQEEVARSLGFGIENHRLILYCRCLKECANRADASAGATAPS
jgi:Fur family ferric uptake transcriptional regulator